MNEPRSSRRALLGAVAGGTAALAGCGSDSGGTDDGIADSADAFGHVFANIPDEVSLNPWAVGYPSNFAPLLFENLTFRTPTGRVLAPLVERVSRDGGHVEVRLADGYSWWNSDDVTARDLWVGERIRALLGRRTHGEATVVGERRIRFDFERPTARELVLSARLNGVLNAPRWHYDSWRQRLADASNGDEREAVGAELRSTQIPLEEAMEVGLGCGPYELTEVSVNRLLLSRYDDHPRSDEISVPRLWFPVAQRQRSNQLIARGDIDGGQGVISREAYDTPDHIQQLARYRTANGTKLVLNWRNPHLARRNVRRAIRCALPLDDIVRNAGWGNPVRTQCGMTAPPAERWLPDSLRESLHDYPSDRERAASFMREAGYTKEGETWVSPEGEPASLVVLSPLWTDWLDASRTVHRALSEFGFETEFEQRTTTAFLTVVQDGTFGILPWWTNGYPHAAYDPTATNFASLGYGVAGEREEPLLGKPRSATIPEEPGALSVTEGREFDVLDAWETLRAPDEEGAAAATELFARWWNYDLPDIDIATGISGVWGNVRDFRWPETDDPRYRQVGPSNGATYHLLKAGAIESVK